MGENVRLDQPATYRVKVRGRLDEGWSAWFGDLVVTAACSEDGAAVTTLTGTVRDQAALHGLLARIRDLGLLLLSVEVVDDLFEHNGGE